MALVNPETLAAQARGAGDLSVLRQLGLMLGLAASVAIGVAVVLWAQGPNYSVLYGSMSGKDGSQVLDALAKAGIPYRMEPRTGSVMVPAAQVHEARLKMAGEGLPRGGGSGFEFLDQQDGMGTSRSLEAARLHRALESELSRSISTLNSVESARVHLAIPKRTVFVRDRTRPRASVLLNLYSGRSLDDSQLAGVVHLVASSVADLEVEDVAVVDQRGRLLTKKNGTSGIAMSAEKFQFQQRLEDAYAKRILDILTPVVGMDGLSAQVTADVDFNSMEQTRESYLPEMLAVRSEQSEEETTGGTTPAGVPGALTNQPPPAGTTRPGADGVTPGEPMRSSRRNTVNYELDRSISHTRVAPGNVRRLSVAVVVDYKEAPDEKGKMQRVPFEAQEMEYLRSLVKEAVGYDEVRGDSISVINTSFKPEVIEPMPEIPFWKEAWLWDALKQVAGGVLVLILLFGVLKPVLKSLVERGASARAAAEAARQQLAEVDGQGRLPAPDGQSMVEQQEAAQMAQEQQISRARQVVKDDPKRVAQLMKTWVNEGD